MSEVSECLHSQLTEANYGNVNKVNVEWMKILILNGPNLNLVGRREPDVYGTESMDDYMLRLTTELPDVEILYLQSNHEGVLIDTLQQFGFGEVDGIVLNAGGLTHTSVSLRDAVAAIEVPVVEVHISNPKAREPFRHLSLLEDVCAHTIAGHGLDGYKEAILWLLHGGHF